MEKDKQLFSDQVQIERKKFYFDLKENPRGRLLRITEDVSGRRDTIVIPATGLDAFQGVLAKVIEADRNAPATPT